MDEIMNCKNDTLIEAFKLSNAGFSVSEIKSIILQGTVGFDAEDETDKIISLIEHGYTVSKEEGKYVIYKRD